MYLLRNADMLFQYYSFQGEKTTCTFFPGQPFLGVFLDLTTKLMVFYLPTLFTYFNFRIYKSRIVMERVNC